MLSFDAQVNLCKAKWSERVVSPYIQAYASAYDKYQATAAAAEKAQEAQMQMFATIATILSTSVIMGAFAHVSLERMVTRAGLRILGRHNTLAVVRLYNQGKANSVVSFASGKLWDMGKDKMNDQSKEIFVRLARNTAGGVTGVLPLVRDKQMQQMVGEQAICMIDGHESIMRDNRMQPAQRTALIDEMRRSRFMQPPKEPLPVQVFENKILLSMYMQKVLDSDYIVTHFPPETRIPAQRGGGIDKLPSEQGYPKSERFEGRLGTYNTVEIDRPGAEFEEATDEVFEKVYGKGKTFYGSSWFRWAIPNSGTGKPSDLLKAEHILKELSFKTRPKTVEMLVA